jgi:GntR family transcriptional regulator
MKLNASISQPLYKQLEDILMQSIESGTFKQGEKIPTELELSKIYNVSRITIRKALEELTRNNYLVRKTGKGTFVSNEKLQRSISGINSFSKVCHTLGREPGAKTIKLVIEDATTEDIRCLDLKTGDKVIVLERIRYADKIPVSIELSRFPESFIFLLNDDFNNTSLYEILDKKYNIRFAQSRKTIEIVFSTYEFSRYLNLSKNYPLLSITSTLIDTRGQKACLSKQLIVGDKFQLIIE